MRTKKGDELGIRPESRIRAQICRDLLSLILKNQSSRSLDRMVVRQRQINGLIKTDQRGILPTAGPHQQQEKDRGQGECPKVPQAHHG